MSRVIAIFLGVLMMSCSVYAQDDVTEQVRKAGEYFSKGEFDKSIAIYDQVFPEIKEDDLKVNVLLMLSSCYLEKGILPYVDKKDDGYYKKSIEYSEKALEIAPTAWPALANIGTVYMNMDELEKADHYFTQAEKFIEPNHPAYQQINIPHELVKMKLNAIREGKKQ